jgi:hypothetical protein
MRAPVWVEVVRNRFSHGAALAPISILIQKFMTGLDFSKKRVEGLAFLVLGWSPYVWWCMLVHVPIFFQLCDND